MLGSKSLPWAGLGDRGLHGKTLSPDVKTIFFFYIFGLLHTIFGLLKGGHTPRLMGN